MEDRKDVNMILAGDVGGTKTILGLFEAESSRPVPILVRTFPTAAFANITSMTSAFFAAAATRGHIVTAACFGVAGPVVARTATLTNARFDIDADEVAKTFGIPRVELLNDLQAMAWSVRVLEASEVHVLQPGVMRKDGNLALIAAGTGVNEVLIHCVDGRFVPAASEAGHADWAARSERDIVMLKALVAQYGRAEVEHVVSGIGLRNIHRVTHPTPCLALVNNPANDPVSDVASEDDPDLPAKMSQAAMARRCAGCVEALSMFVEAYGAEAGNLALRSFATGGVFIGGGIAPKILPLLSDGQFMRAFLDKGEFRGLLTRVPVKVILNPEAGLIGAAVSAAQP